MTERGEVQGLYQQACVRDSIDGSLLSTLCLVKWQGQELLLLRAIQKWKQFLVRFNKNTWHSWVASRVLVPRQGSPLHVPLQFLSAEYSRVLGS